jgi:hypothetical protein
MTFARSFSGFFGGGTVTVDAPLLKTSSFSRTFLHRKAKTHQVLHKPPSLNLQLSLRHELTNARPIMLNLSGSVEKVTSPFSSSRQGRKES